MPVPASVSFVGVPLCAEVKGKTGCPLAHSEGSTVREARLTWHESRQGRNDRNKRRLHRIPSGYLPSTRSRKKLDGRLTEDVQTWQADMTLLILEQVGPAPCYPSLPQLSNATVITARRIHGAVAWSVSLNNLTGVRQEEAHAATLQRQETARKVEGWPGTETP
jgi:hypothetical protein